ncbi:hypothetical protein BCU68_15660 [Vibrio sp. 10N.286.49.B3]|uniref:hypothetical protein n=1 Tax=Vibrio sp. 10N.286.49.B3 TaxID=1880855 RepID=UPI000C845E74|nr:hypothetical protein [Vibrio sp. 10N.286.49.B3]PMH41395.1 hypothetical protein BCU68_15660 [Vibrio sp. 10N.286.49.B3]
MSRSHCYGALLGILACLPLTSFANNFNYNKVEVRMGTSPGTFGGEVTTYMTENSHLVGRIDSGLSGDWDAAVGIGFNGPINQFGDIFGQMLIHNINSDNDKNKFKTEINIGSRFWLMQGIEFHARLGQLIYDDKTNSTYGIGLRFHSTEQLSVGSEFINNGTYGTQLLMSARFHY